MSSLSNNKVSLKSLSGLQLLYISSTMCSLWEEDEDSNGNGTECCVKILAEENITTLDELLKKVGQVPIPPYL